MWLILIIVVGLVVAAVVAGRLSVAARGRERAEAEAADRAEEAQREALARDVRERERAKGEPTGVGRCPDCQYTPVAPSCKVCPRCGCTMFVREIGIPRRETRCDNCRYWITEASFSCEECDGDRKVTLTLVKDFRTGSIYWERVKFLWR
jgi:hypothetical protein